jgi:protein O-GlcNAc transferase
MPDLLAQAIQHAEAGRLADAEAIFRRILAADQDNAEALGRLGMIFLQKNQWDSAISFLRRALSAAPGRADFHCLLAMSLAGAGRTADALGSYRKAVELRKDFAEAWYNFGSLLTSVGNLPESIEAMKLVTQLRPDLADGWNGLGVSQLLSGQKSEAEKSFRKALELRPNYGQALGNLAGVLDALDQTDQAIPIARRAVEATPAEPLPHANLGNLFFKTGQVEPAIAEFRQATALHRAHSDLLWAMHFLPCDPDELFQEHLRWSRQHARRFSGDIHPHPNNRDPDRRLRIGYISPDFRRHSVAFFLEKLFAHHDAKQVEIFCYSDVATPDAETGKLQNSAHHWRNIRGIPDAAAAGQIRADKIDILIDLTGHTANSRLLLFAQKPAPIQATYLGYPDTTGLPTMDYRITDSHADPEGKSDQRATEKLIRLPHSFLCYSAPPEAPPPKRDPGPITFGSFNNIAKLSPMIIQLWSKILQQTPGSKLILKNAGLSQPAARENLAKRFSENGIPPERLELLGYRADTAEHLALYNRIDITLDTFPYHGTATTCESLWMGVPVVTLAGEIHASRVGASLLNAVGLLNWIAHTPQEYVKIATSRAIENSTEARQKLRQEMLASPLMDGESFAQEMETAYRDMWHRWR